MSDPARPTRLTYEDLLRLPDDGLRHEIIDGVHYVTPSPSRAHQKIVVELVWRIRAYLEENRRGELFTAPFDVVLSMTDVVEPDLLYVSRERLEILTEADVRGAPDLIVEILSPSTRTRDLEIKRDLYEQRGVREYWIVDPEERWVEVLRRRGEGLRQEARLDSGQELDTPLLPGLTIPLAKLFSE